MCVSRVSLAVGLWLALCTVLTIEGLFQTPVFVCGCTHMQAWNLKQAASWCSVWTLTLWLKSCRFKTLGAFFCPLVGQLNIYMKWFLACDSRRPFVYGGCFFCVFTVEEEKEWIMEEIMTQQQKHKIEVKIWFTSSLKIQYVVWWWLCSQAWMHTSFVVYFQIYR